MSKIKSVIGKCKLCGMEKELTFEHVPPHKAFNDSAVKILSAEDSIKMVCSLPNELPNMLLDVKGRIQQRGSGDFYLCRECNNNTGTWYVNEYVYLANIMSVAILEARKEQYKSCSCELKSFGPLKFFKAVMTMFCDINVDCFGDDSLRQFLLNKESMEFNHDRYSVYFYLSKGPFLRIHKICGMFDIYSGRSTLLSEISACPLGFILYIDKPDSVNPVGININDMAKYNYGYKSDYTINDIPILEVNNMLPATF